jgi:hypothetical protein
LGEFLDFRCAERQVMQTQRRAAGI